MKRNALLFAIMFVAILAMLATGKYLDRTRKHGPSKMVGDVRGMAAPNFDLATLDGRRVKLSDYRGKAVLLNFWATWCAPCQVEMPMFARWQKQYGPQQLAVIGISMDDDSESARRTILAQRVDYPVAMGDATLGQRYGGVLGLPLTFLIDRNGIVRAKFQGETDLGKIEASLRSLLATHRP